MRNHAMEADSKGYSTGYDSKYDSKGYAPDYKSSAKSVAPQYYNTPQVMTTDEWFQMSTSEQTSPTPSPQHLRHPTTVDDSKAENPIMGSFFGGLVSSLSGQNSTQQQNYGNNIYLDETEDYENEPPLLEELGVNFEHIFTKTQAVMYPIKPIGKDILADTDLAGPLVFCLLLGSCLLLSGKVHFGYIYGFSVFGCLGLMVVVNLLHPTGLDFWTVCSALGYCLIPVIALAAISIVVNLQGLLGVLLSSLSIAWATYAATRLLDARLDLTNVGQYWLVAYPIMLFYSCFVLITIF